MNVIANWIATLIVMTAWVGCGVLAYRRARATARRKWKWTNQDRITFLVLGTLGPITLFAVIMSTFDNDKEVRW